MPEFDTGSPTVRHIQSYIRENSIVEIQMSTGEIFSGNILWQDGECICLILKTQQKKVLLWRQSLVYIRSELE
ncbi:MAG: RNA-binding protein hfq [Cyanobacteriota bacterium ELA615]|jgi:host factor-I protein